MMTEIRGCGNAALAVLTRATVAAAVAVSVPVPVKPVGSVIVMTM